MDVFRTDRATNRHCYFVADADIRRRILRKDAVPSQFVWKVTSPECSARTQRLARRTVQQTTVLCDDDIVAISPDFNSTDVEVAAEEVYQCTASTVTTSGTQTDIHDTFTKSCETQTYEHYATFSVLNFVNDNAGMKYYTGLECYSVFVSVLSSLGPSVYKLHYLYDRKPQLPVCDQLFLTLVKLRTYKPNFELSRLFCITEAEVYVIFVTWIRFMSSQWREIVLWPNREAVDFFAPLDMKQRFPTTRVIIDGTEIPVKKPKLPAAQQISFSNYKNRNTAKGLIGVSPGGLVSFVSDSYGGCASDRQIVERSGLTNLLEPGDSVMADKGFDVQDIFAPYNVTVNMPTFFRKKNRISHSTLLRDRKISSKRVHVERVIGLGKTYTILTNPVNQTEAILSSDIVFICYMLVNMRPCIVPVHA